MNILISLRNVYIFARWNTWLKWAILGDQGCATSGIICAKTSLITYDELIKE
jgi:hypothetical protein